MKIEKKDWNKDKQRPKKVDATYNSYTITSELVRYEDALNKALNLQPDVSSETIVGRINFFRTLLVLIPVFLLNLHLG